MRTSALILAGGLGTRLRSVVADRPKVLAEVCGRPFLFNLFDMLVDAGYRHVVLATGYRAEAVEEAIAGGYRGLDLECSVEPEPRGTGGAIALAAPRLCSPRALVLNGDSFCAADLRHFEAEHRERGASASILVTDVEDVGRYGQVVVDGDTGAVTAFHEKPSAQNGQRREAAPASQRACPRRSRGEEQSGLFAPRQQRRGLINAGVYLLEERALSAIPRQREPVSFERDVLPRLIGAGLYAQTSGGPFIDIGLPSTYAQANSFFGGGQHG